MTVLMIALLVAAGVCFLAATFGVSVGRPDLVALGLFLLTLVWLAGAVTPHLH